MPQRPLDYLSRGLGSPGPFPATSRGVAIRRSQPVLFLQGPTENPKLGNFGVHDVEFRGFLINYTYSVLCPKP